MLFTLPVPAKTGIIGIAHGRENGLSGGSVQGQVNGSSVSVTLYNNTYPGATGAVIFLAGFYEANV